MIQPGTLVRHKLYPDELYIVLGPVFPPDKTKKYTRYQTEMVRLLSLIDNGTENNHPKYLEEIQSP